MAIKVKRILIPKITIINERPWSVFQLANCVNIAQPIYRLSLVRGEKFNQLLNLFFLETQWLKMADKVLFLFWKIHACSPLECSIADRILNLLENTFFKERKFFYRLLWSISVSFILVSIHSKYIQFISLVLRKLSFCYSFDFFLLYSIMNIKTTLSHYHIYSQYILIILNSHTMCTMNLDFLSFLRFSFDVDVYVFFIIHWININV